MTDHEPPVEPEPAGEDGIESLPVVDAASAGQPLHEDSPGEDGIEPLPAVDEAIEALVVNAEEVERWNTLALACCWPLGRSVDVHMATEVSPKVLSAALQLYLRLLPDELLLVIIDRSGGRKPASGCALTTRRLYWADVRTKTGRDGHGDGERDDSEPIAPPLSRSIRYEDLDRVDRDGSIRRVGEAGTSDRLAPISQGFPSASPLFEVLNDLGRAARGEPVSNVPAAEEIARRDLPDIVRRAEATRTTQRWVDRSFPSLLKAATPRVVATPVFAAVCLVVFAAMIGSGVSPMTRDPIVLWNWGANNGASVILDGEAWRMLTGMFLHYGLIHLGFNIWFLLKFGPLVERLFGSAGFAALYLISGLGGSLASLWFHPTVVSAGASGALFGIVGALLGYLAVRRDVTPSSVVQLFSPGLLAYLAIDSLLGLFLPQVDGAAHIGGLVAGFACGLALSRPWPPPPLVYAGRRRMASAVLLTCGLAVTFLLARPGIRARLERDPEVIASYAKENAQQTYAAFYETILPDLQAHDDISREFYTVSRHVDQQDESDDLIAFKLDRLISEADRSTKRIRSLAIGDPKLRLARDRIASAQAHQHDALAALRTYLKTNDLDRLKGADRYEEHIRENKEDADAFNAACQEYLKSNGLEVTPP